jgi:large-conductance mechanosensitive channel
VCQKIKHQKGSVIVMRYLISIIISFLLVGSLVVVSGCKQKSEGEKTLEEIIQPESEEEYAPEEEKQMEEKQMEEQPFE